MGEMNYEYVYLVHFGYIYFGCNILLKYWQNLYIVMCGIIHAFGCAYCVGKCWEVVMMSIL